MQQFIDIGNINIGFGLAAISILKYCWQYIAQAVSISILKVLNWFIDLYPWKGNLTKVPAEKRDKYSDFISSTRTLESAGEIIAENEFNDICNLGKNFNL